MKKFKLPNNKTSLRQALDYAADFLKQSGVDDPHVDALIFMEDITGYSPNEYFMRRDDDMTEIQKRNFTYQISKRGQRIPLQHILKRAWFYGRSFYTDKKVLIPRQDTEILVREALKHIRPGMDVLDLCTGSGCIAVTLAKEADICVTASDISVDALEIAKWNASYHNAVCEFKKSDMFDNISGKYDLIVSNPPYIKSAEIAMLQPEVRDHDPKIALDGGIDGLKYYRIIAKKAGKYLKEKGGLLVEIGADQAGEVMKIFSGAGFTNIKIVNDLNRLPRVALCHAPAAKKIFQGNA